MKYIVFSFLIIYSFTAFSQETYTKVFDLDKDALYNSIYDIEILDDNIFVYASHACFFDVNEYNACVSLSKFNMSGELIHLNLLDSFGFVDCCYKGLISYGQKLMISTTAIDDEPSVISLIEFDTNLSPLSIKRYDEKEKTSSLLINSGITKFEDHIYIFNTIKNPVDLRDSVSIIKTDLEGNVLKRFYYSSTINHRTLLIDDLQASPDGNLVFNMRLFSRAGINSPPARLIMKIDTEGTLLDSFAFNDVVHSRFPGNVFATSDGGYVFSSVDHPITGTDLFTTGYGLINKLEQNMDSLEWTIILPNDQLVDRRLYHVLDYYEANNGEIIACGMVFDNTDTELSTGIPDVNATFNGFLVRIGIDGAIKWLKLYKNHNEILPQSEFGKFHHSKLNRVVELPDGRILSAGSVYLNTDQFHGIDRTETDIEHLWILMVNEDGCVDGFECEEIIRLIYNPEELFSIGDKWTYETRNHPSSFIGFKEYSIIDTSQWHGETVFVVEPGLYDDFDYMLVKDKKVYFWDEELSDYQLNYDFDNDTSYYIKYRSNISNQIDSTIVLIDSISIENINGIEHIVQHCRSALGRGNGDIKVHFKVYNKIGQDSAGLRLEIKTTSSNITEDVQRIRCFENSTQNYTFTEVACDSTWIATNTNNITIDPITIYPNPTHLGVWIDGVDGEIDFEIYDQNGVLLKKGIARENFIALDKTGSYLIRVRVKDRWILKRVIMTE